MPEIFLAQLCIIEFRFSGDFPEKIQIDIVGDPARFGQKLRRFVRTELKKDIPCPNLGPFSARQFDLIGFTNLIQNIARSELAGLFKE